MFAKIVCIGFLSLIASPLAFAQEIMAPVVPREISTPAFRQFQNRPQTELSRLLYLVDLLEKAKVEIVYNGRHYKPIMLSPLIRLHIARNFKGKETAESWIAKWCHRSRKGSRIYVKLADGNTLAAKDILMGELERLDTLCKNAD